MADESQQSPLPPVLLRFQAPLLIAGATAAGYWLAHGYEAAYLDYFHLPNSLVRVGANATLVAVGGIASLALASLIVATGIAGIARSRAATYWSNFLAFTLSLSLFHACARIFISDGWKGWIGAVVWAAVMLLATLLHRKYSARWSALGRPPDPEPAEPNFVRILREHVGREGLLVFFLLGQAHSIAQGAGRSDAARAEDFLVLREPAHHVVLRSYDDMIIAVRVDRASKMVEDEVVLLVPSKLASIATVREHLGRLKPKPLRPDDVQLSAARGEDLVCLPGRDTGSK